MSQIGAILKAKARIARHSIAAIRHESKLKVGVVSVAAFLLWLSLFRAFLWGFYWLRTFLPETQENMLSIGDILMVRLLSVFALALFFMLIFSNVLVAFSTLYRAREVQYLVQAPISTPVFFLGRFMESVSFSSWASGYLGTPLLLAYGITTDAHWGYYLAALFFYVPFVTIPAAIGSIIAMIFVRVFPRLPRLVMMFLGACAISALFLYLRQSFSADRLAQDSVLTVIMQVAGQTQSPLLPSYWASQGVLHAAQNEYAQTFFLLLLLVSNALFAVWLAAFVADRVFLSGFSTMIGSDRNELRPLGKGILGRLDRLLNFLHDPIRPLVIKDIKLFWRDPTQWTQFIIFFGIMAIYVVNLRNNSDIAASDGMRSFVAGLNTAACALILASLTSRFAYPLISLEGFRFWILGLAPLTIRQLIWQKFWLSFCATSPFTVGLVVLSCFVLDLDPLRFSLAVYTIFLANLALAGLAVGLGSLYPNFEEDNPARIVSGMGGTLNFLLSVGYITLVVGAQMAITMWHDRAIITQQQTFLWALAAVVAAITLLTAVSALLPMKLGLKNLMRTEF